MGIWDDYSASSVIETTNIDTGTVTVDSFGDTEGKGVIWQYVIDKGSGTNMRVGIIKSVWDTVADSSPVMMPDEFSSDIGTTLGVVSFAVDKSSNTVRLRATVTSDDWAFYAVRTFLGIS
ncbi:MAG: hypothetical protein HQ589_01740 [Syntrophaceae bacterium]|nr:hypothetical protein [Syntrophaceae bacterium]